MREEYECSPWETDKELLHSWDAMLNDHRDGGFDTEFFKELFKNTWAYLIEHTSWGSDNEVCIDTCHIPLILRVYDFSKRREVPADTTRRVFETATTFCESLVDSLSKNFMGEYFDPDKCGMIRQAIVTGYIELGISWDFTKVIHIDQFEEEFKWLCQHYGDTYGY